MTTQKKHGTEVKYALLWLKSKLQSKDAKERIAARVILKIIASDQELDTKQGRTWDKGKVKWNEK